MSISWSYLYLGKVARTSTNKKQKNNTFKAKITDVGTNEKKAQGAYQPPKNNIVAKVAINNMLLYSPKKNIANVNEEYSTL